MKKQSLKNSKSCKDANTNKSANRQSSFDANTNCKANESDTRSAE